MGKVNNTVAAQIRARMEKEGATPKEIDEVLEEHYRYVRENAEYIGDLLREQGRGRYAPRNEKENATMRILYDEDV